MDWREAGGMVKELVRFVFMEVPCWTENVWSCAKIVLKIIVHAKIGINERIVFTCSTCFLLHNVHALSFVFVPFSILTHALSRNLNYFRNILYMLITCKPNKYIFMCINIYIYIFTDLNLSQ